MSNRVLTPQKLHFKAFMYERVEDSDLERERTRVFELHYHVADGKLKVHEPMVDNSGLWQVSNA